MHVPLVAHHGGGKLLGLEVVPVLLQLATLLHLHHLALQWMQEALSQRSHSMLTHTAELTLLMGAHGKKAAACVNNTLAVLAASAMSVPGEGRA